MGAYIQYPDIDLAELSAALPDLSAPVSLCLEFPTFKPPRPSLSRSKSASNDMKLAAIRTAYMQSQGGAQIRAPRPLPVRPDKRVSKLILNAKKNAIHDSSIASPKSLDHPSDAKSVAGESHKSPVESSDTPHPLRIAVAASKNGGRRTAAKRTSRVSTPRQAAPSSPSYPASPSAGTKVLLQHVVIAPHQPQSIRRQSISTDNLAHRARSTLDRRSYPYGVNGGAIDELAAAVQVYGVPGDKAKMDLFEGELFAEQPDLQFSLQRKQNAGAGKVPPVPRKNSKRSSVSSIDSAVDLEDDGDLGTRKNLTSSDAEAAQKLGFQPPPKRSQTAPTLPNAAVTPISPLSPTLQPPKRNSLNTSTTLSISSIPHSSVSLLTPPPSVPISMPQATHDPNRLTMQSLDGIEPEELISGFDGTFERRQPGLLNKIGGARWMGMLGNLRCF